MSFDYEYIYLTSFVIGRHDPFFSIEFRKNTRTYHLPLIIKSKFLNSYLQLEALIVLKKSKK